MKGGRNNDPLLLGKYSEGSVVDGFGGDHVGVHRRGLLVERSLQSFVLGGLVVGWRMIWESSSTAWERNWISKERKNWVISLPTFTFSDSPKESTSSSILSFEYLAVPLRAPCAAKLATELFD